MSKYSTLYQAPRSDLPFSRREIRDLHRQSLGGSGLAEFPANPEEKNETYTGHQHVDTEDQVAHAGTRRTGPALDQHRVRFKGSKRRCRAGVTAEPQRHRHDPGQWI